MPDKERDSGDRRKDERNEREKLGRREGDHKNRDRDDRERRAKDETKGRVAVGSYLQRDEVLIQDQQVC